MTESKEVTKKRDAHAKLLLCLSKSIAKFLTDILVAIALVVV